MRIKLLLLLCCLFAIEGWSKSNEIRLKRSGVEPNPVGIPITPTTEKCSIFSKYLNISFDKVEIYAKITVMNKKTGEVVHVKTCHNTNFAMIDMSDCDEGEYSIHISMNNYSLEGTFII